MRASHIKNKDAVYVSDAVHHNLVKAVYVKQIEKL